MQRRGIRRTLELVAASLLVVPFIAVAGATPAAAISCSSPDIGVWAEVRYKSVAIGTTSYPRRVRLSLINERINDESTARVTGDLLSGDRVWVQRRTSSSAAWESCAKTTVAYDAQTEQRANHAAGNVGAQMRACVDFLVYGSARQTICTASYTDSG